MMKFPCHPWALYTSAKIAASSGPSQNLFPCYSGIVDERCAGESWKGLFQARIDSYPSSFRNFVSTCFLQPQFLRYCCQKEVCGDESRKIRPTNGHLGPKRIPNQSSSLSKGRWLLLLRALCICSRTHNVGLTVDFSMDWIHGGETGSKEVGRGGEIQDGVR